MIAGYYLIMSKIDELKTVSVCLGELRTYKKYALKELKWVVSGNQNRGLENHGPRKSELIVSIPFLMSLFLVSLMFPCKLKPHLIFKKSGVFSLRPC
jgi:hypothetical protein